MFAFTQFVFSVWSWVAGINAFVYFFTYSDLNHCHETLSARSVIDLGNFPCKLFSCKLALFLYFFILSYFFFPSISTIKSSLTTSINIGSSNFSKKSHNPLYSLSNFNPRPPLHLFKCNLAILTCGWNKHVNIYMLISFLTSYPIAQNLPQSNQQLPHYNLPHITPIDLSKEIHFLDTIPISLTFLLSSNVLFLTYLSLLELLLHSLI